MLDTQKLKARKNILNTLKAEKGISTQKARVVLVIDTSASMTNWYRNGAVQETFERVLPFGLSFDDDGEVDVYAFDASCREISEKIKITNVDGFVQRYILDRQLGGGTDYAKPMNKIIQKFGNPKSGGFLGLGGSTGSIDIPTFVIFITDGNCGDPTETRQAIIEASNHAIFWKFIGIGNERFAFLQELDDMSGRRVDNADLKKWSDLPSVPDSQFFPDVMEEFDTWLTAVKSEKILL